MRTPESTLTDSCGRSITYLRVSVTDRCDLRCTYCMPKQMAFSPRSELLTFEELHRVSRIFMDLGVSKIRVTGGEPLVRKGLLGFLEALSTDLSENRLAELSLTTNGTQLASHVPDLVRCGIKRVNVSVDTIDPDRYRALTRGGELGTVLRGLRVAKAAGLHIKINAVALSTEWHELPRLINWAHAEGFDVSLIETMPMGQVGADRSAQYLSLADVKAELAERWTLIPSLSSTGGPSRYVDVQETGGRLGFITPIAENFCASCNRVRLTCTGTLYPCLGQEQKLDLRALIRAGADDHALIDAIRTTILHKPKAHDFTIAAGTTPAVPRTMSVTGG